MRVYYSDQFRVPLPAGHRFPMAKYALLRETLLARGVLDEQELTPAPAITRQALLNVHDPAYVDAVFAGGLDERALRKLGFPWSEALLARTLASVGGTLAAARAALREGFAGNLAGGTHHAHRDHGSGFCVFNDIAVAAATLLAEGAVGQVLVYDADVHQGDGTAAIFAAEPRVFTCSLHGRRNFPFLKQRSDLDVELDDGTEDEAWLAAVEAALATCAARCRPDLVFFQAGVDALAADRLGRLAVSHAGMAARDHLVLAWAKQRGVPIVTTLGGGYADPVEASVAAHVGTYEAAKRVFGAAAARSTPSPPRMR